MVSQIAGGFEATRGREAQRVHGVALPPSLPLSLLPLSLPPLPLSLLTPPPFQSLGMVHFGVIRTLRHHGLLPRIVSGGQTH
jgi:hypothetical protein